jgi:hypothetical protein
MVLPVFAKSSNNSFLLNDQKSYYGVRLGLNLATLTGEAPMKFEDTKVGLYLGGVMGFRLSRPLPLFLETGVYYTERGGKKEGTKCTLNSFEVPLLIKYGISTGTPVSVYPFVGPYFSYATSGKFSDGNSALSDSRYHHGDMGIKMGWGLDYQHLYLDVSYQLGILNISALPGASARTSNFNVSLGYNF